MFRVEDVLQLKDREEVRHVTRRHILTMFPGLFLGLVLIVLPFFLIFPLFSWGVLGVALFFIAVLLGISSAVRTLLLWDADILIVTTLRLVDVDQRGLFSRIVSEAPLDAVQDVSWSRRGVIQTIFRIGNLKVQTAGATANIEAHNIPHPEQVHELINDLRHVLPVKAAMSATPTPTANNDSPDKDSRLKRIESILDKYSPEELARIESILKERERAAVTEAFLKPEGRGEEKDKAV